MADKIKKFFQKRKSDKDFKKAGPGYKLNEESTSRDTTTGNPSSSSAAGNAQPARSQQASEVASRAGAAALARLGGQKEVDWSLAAIRAQARKELELEQQAANAKAKTEQLAPQVAEKPAQLGVQGLLFRCPILGPQALPREELDVQLMEFLSEHLAEEKGLSAALMIVTCNKNEAAVRACIDILNKYLSNVLDNPTEEKYRRIKMSNKVFREKVEPIAGSKEFLEAAGFVPKQLDDGEFYLCLAEGADLELLPALKDALSSAEPLETVLDRNPRVLLPSQSAGNFSVPEDFYSMTADEVAKEQANRTREAELMTQLRTKAMRERDAKRETRIYKYTLIRIRLPNGLMLQGTFEITERLADVYEFLADCLLDSCANPLLKSGLDALTAHERTLEELKLYPAVVLNCIVETSSDSDILKPELLALVSHLE